MIFSLQATKGYKIDFAHDPIATETGSLNIQEETKRKIRISAGGTQAVIKLLHLLNPFKYGKLAFQYISHRALRWTLTPIAIVTTFIANMTLAFSSQTFFLLFIAQLAFYLLAALGYMLKDRPTKFKLTYIPYYFIYMHYYVVLGWIKYFSGKQKVTWDKAKRASGLRATTN